MFTNKIEIGFKLTSLFNGDFIKENENFELSFKDFDDKFILSLKENVLTIKDNFTGYETYIKNENNKFYMNDNYSDDPIKEIEKDKIIIFNIDEFIYYIEDKNLTKEENLIDALFG